ncbi:protein of unknown function DUF892 [Candidatus Nitrososphaera gargensis Ga9.2]|uniref:Uncharacterized protein n=2 Tax=Candidatus Nitrososphaera gargensis TaxID=497727 RepID=K0IAS5_NITGG|nr:protein of unknown function DUF892 [Candidatus Nitrososphaera gargensis Ga9.2]
MLNAIMASMFNKMVSKEKRVGGSESEIHATGRAKEDDSATADAASIRPSEVFDSAKYNAMSDMAQGASLHAKNVESLIKTREAKTLESRQVDNESITAGRSNPDNMQTQITPMMVEERARTIRAANKEIQQMTSNTHSRNDKFVLYLNLMLSIENAAVERLHARIQQSPLAQIRQQLVHHLKETREQKERLISLITRLGGQPTGERAELPGYSPPKLLADALNASATAPEEQELKTLEADALIEHAEMIAYNTLIQMAVKMNIGEAMVPLRQSLQEEEEMVAWTRANLPSNFAQLWAKIA